MRIAVLNWSSRRVAGTEAYLATVIPALQAAGHAVALVSEVDEPADREPIALTSSGWCVAVIGMNHVVAELRRWQPDVLYGHGMLDPALESRLLDIAPGAFFAHGFYGTCISGAKSFKTPVGRPCDRRFGWPCLLHYFPHRCGGWNPVTMGRDFRRQRSRLELLGRYAAIVTHSRRMESEYLKHGFPPERVHRVPWCVRENGGPVPQAAVRPGSDSRPHLVFLGRMTWVKGGHVLLHALPGIRAMLGRDIRVTFAGDGPERATWERHAARLQKRQPGLDVTFAGWLTPGQRDSLLDDSDLLVLPSIWPEPFGQVGIEAGRRGVPTAAFAVGGVPDWLEDGVNGFLAPADPPSPRGLAAAVANCLNNPETLTRLRQGAADVAGRYSIAAHLARLEPILGSIARHSSASGAGPAA
jgi:glycosyltransferase involved in cell wall biosynthesis